MSSMQDGQQWNDPPQGAPQQGGYPMGGYQQYGPPQGYPQQFGLPPNGPPQPGPSKKRKKWPWILLAVLVLIVGMFACNPGSGQDAETTSGSEESASGTDEAAEAEGDEGAETLGIGDTGQMGDWMVTVNGTETAATFGGEFVVEQAQGEFVIVDLTVENGGSDATYFDDTALSLIDADGNSHSVTPTASDDSFFLQQINPGNQASGTAAFDVPEGTEPVALEVEDLWSFEDPLEISLN